MRTAFVKKSTGSWYQLIDQDGNVYNARIKGKFRLEDKKTTNPVAVGDLVKFELENDSDAIITELIPRSNYLIRKSNNLSKQQHIIASNIDLVMIMATIANPRTSQGFIDRILVTAEAYEIPAVIIFNKSDEFSADDAREISKYCKMYDNLGYQCFPVSVKKEENLEKIKMHIHGKKTLVTGHSGVGKSSLLNVLNSYLSIKTNTISGYSLKGKHTTTFAEMHQIDRDTYLIDTPGIKDFGLIDIGTEEVSHFFPEMRKFLGKCKFNNCMHINEPGCEVLNALKKGEIFQSRYQSYLSILNQEETHR